MFRCVLGTILLLTSITTAHAQETSEVTGFHLSPSFTDRGSVRPFESLSEANEVVNRIVLAVGVVSPNFTVVATDRVSNAAAWIKGNKRYIGYKPSFMQGVLAKAGRNYFSLIGVVAHEIGHHFLGHTVDDLVAVGPDSSAARNAVGLSLNETATQDRLARMRRDELDADYFSGFVLAKLGASKEDVVAWLSSISDAGGPTHPPKIERKKKIEDGWSNATSAVTSARNSAAEKMWDHNGSSMKLVASGERRLFFYESPRQVIRDRGVDKGTLLFDGRIDGDKIEGLIYAFSFECGKFGYQATGKVKENGRVIEMTGMHPTINKDCEVVRRREEKLIFISN